MRYVQTVTPISCPNGHHKLAKVWGNGTYTSQGQKYQRYRCIPRKGRKHTFSVLRDEKGAPVVVRYQPPPPCPIHPDAKHVRDGTYAGKNAPRRQRYRCYGNGKPRGHAYTPALPRSYVGDHGFAEPCELCEEPRGTHRGTQATARQQTWASPTVAQGLMFSARGETYGETGRWAVRVSPPRAARTIGTPTRKPEETAESNRRWHIAADWVETYAPVFWEPLEAELKARALAERRRIDADVVAGLPLRRPIIWVADELTIFGKSDELFSVLVVAEAHWRDGSDVPHLRLRVARAMPDRSTAAWRLVFDELARVPGESAEIWPDFIVADGGSAIRNAAEARFGGRTRWVPSTWHLGYRVREAYLGKHAPRRRLDYEALEVHLDQLARASDALATVEGWHAWWERLAVLMPGSSWVKFERKTYEPAYTAVIPDLANSRIPISNAGLEELIKSRITPLFYKRTSFTSIERTNHLTDLAVAHAHQRLDKVHEVARLLREDAHAHGGWATSLRAVADPMNLDTRVRYRSLRDRSLTSRIAYARAIP
jgi:hypothetical protein